MKYLYAFALSVALHGTVQAQNTTQPADITTLPTPAPDTSSVESAPGYSVELDKRYGFRGLRFETPLQQVKGLKLVANRGGKAIYQKVTENKTLGNARLKTVLYCFYKGKLSDIVISATGSTNADEVLKVLTQAYGAPYEQELTEDDLDGHFYWHGKTVIALLSIPIDEDEFSVLISSIPLKKRQEKDEEQRVKQAADKL